MQEENKTNDKEKELQKSGDLDSTSNKDEILKDGIEKLKEIGLKNVSNKTFINLQNLTYLLDKDFEKLHKTKALGFIQILERDFKVDLSELKDDYLDFQNGGRRRGKKVIKQNRETKDSSSKTVEKKSLELKNYQARRSPQKPIDDNVSDIKIGPYILIALAALLGYYLFSSATEDENQLEVLDLNVVQNESIVKKAKENLLAVESDTNATNTTTIDEDIDLNKVVHEMFKEADINDSELEETDVDDNATTVENNQTTNSISNSTSLVNKNNDINHTLINKSISKVDVKQNKNEDNKTKIATSQKSNQKDDLSTNETPKIKSYASKDELYILPTQKAWVGVIYLDNFKKKDFLIRKKLRLDPNRDQIILIGHKNFKIYSHGERESFNSKKMVRFIYEGGNLREISKAEYLKRSAGVRW